MSNKLTISRNLLNKFIKQKRLYGIVSFLNFIKKSNHLKDFYNFCEIHDCSLRSFKNLKTSILFHGSQKAQSLLMPKKFVYATDEPNYAIFLAILQLKNSGARVVADDKKTILNVDFNFVNGTSKLTNGYVHIVSGESFKKTKNREYKNSKKIRVLFAIPVTPKDLTVPIHISIS